MAEQVAVPVKSAWTSKINWVQAVAVVAALGTMFGVDLSPEDQVKIITGITVVQGFVTGVIKTWFTPTVTPQSVPPSVVL